MIIIYLINLIFKNYFHFTFKFFIFILLILFNFECFYFKILKIQIYSKNTKIKKIIMNL